MVNFGKMADEQRTIHLESTIPILLIIILAIFVAGRFGVINFSDVPILKNVFPAPEIKVAAVGKISKGLSESPREGTTASVNSRCVRFCMDATKGGGIVR